MKCICYLFTFSLFLFTFFCTGPVAAQILTVENGATLTLDNGSVLDLGTTTTLVETGGGRVTGGTGTITATRTLNAPQAIDVAGLGAVITSDANLGTTTVTRGFVPQAAANGNEGIARYYDVEPATNTGLGATLAFTYFDEELNGQDEATLVLFRSEDDGETWEQAGGTVNAAINTVTFTGIDAFSRWTAAGEDAPLPVELASFTASVEDQAVVLSWKTLSEKGNDGFAVEWKNGRKEAWKQVAFVEGRGTLSSGHTYRYRVEGLDYGTYTFRLRQEDLDGTTETLGEVEAVVALAEAYAISKVYPNPSSGKATVEVAVREAQRVRVEIYDVLGRRVATPFDKQMSANDTRRVRLDGSALSSGVYFVRVVGEDFAEVRKVTLVR